MDRLSMCLAIMGLTIILGWLKGRKIINRPPMEILRGMVDLMFEG